MKIFEIINTKYTPKSNNNPEKDRPIKSAGYYANVLPDEDEHMVNKTYKRPRMGIENEPYYMYIKTIADNNLASSNPFFPRVYEYSSNTDEYNYSRPVFKMEKLKHYNEFPEEIFYEIGKNLIKDFENTCEFFIKKNAYFRGICDVMNNAIILNDFSDIKDNNLKSALKIIYEIKQQTIGAGADLQKPENTMIRSTRYGPQLVITDPLG